MKADKKSGVMIIGKGRSGIYADAFFDRWKEVNENVEFFSTNDFFREDNVLRHFLTKLEDRISIGWNVARINREVLCAVERYDPGVVFIYLDRYIRKDTVVRLKKRGIILIAYNNDDPFSRHYPRYFWRNYRNMLPYTDIAYVYREKNIADCQKNGVRDARILRSYYIRERNYYIKDPQTREQVPKVVFLGHYENDGRADYINALLCNDISVGVPATTGEHYAESERKILLKYSTEDYNEELNAAEIALVFLSSINNDTYTRRCFEIPATKTLMMSVYTADIAGMFEEDKECVFFRSVGELVQKTKYYLENGEERKRIAEAGHARLMRDGHEIGDRVRQVIHDIEGLDQPA